MKYLWSVLLLTACAPQEPVYKPVVVDVPVIAECYADFIKKPDFAVQYVTASDDLPNKIKAVLIELDQRRAYEVELVAWEAGCAREQSSAAN